MSRPAATTGKPDTIRDGAGKGACATMAFVAHSRSRPKRGPLTKIQDDFKRAQRPIHQPRGTRMRQPQRPAVVRPPVRAVVDGLACGPSHG